MRCAVWPRIMGGEGLRGIICGFFFFGRGVLGGEEVVRGVMLMCHI